MFYRRLQTPRLELISGSPELLSLEWEQPERFIKVIDARFPKDWPPGEYDANARNYFESKYQSNPEAREWLIWYVIERSTRTLIGAFGFVDAPGASGEVCLGYSVSTDFRGFGYATEGIAELVLWAFSQPGVRRIVAEAMPENIGSIRVLAKNGFREVGPGTDPENLRFERDPGIFPSHSQL